MDVDAEDRGGFALVVAGGDEIERAILVDLPTPAWVIAADSGLDHAIALGIRPDVVIGDMDSVDLDLLATVERAGVLVERFPADKDATDLELALDRVIAQGLERAIVIGGHGRRFGHLLGNALLIAAGHFAEVHIEWWIGTTHVAVVRQNHPAHIKGSAGDIVSILAVGGDAGGVTATGLRWPLDDAQLVAGSTRGIGNRMTDPEGTVTVGDGVLLVIHERT